MAHKLITAAYKKFYNDLPYGSPSTIKIALDKNDYEGEVGYPAGEKDFELDLNGEFIDTNGIVDGKLSLWCNGNGNTGSKYKVTEPDGVVWEFVLQTDSPNNLAVLRSQQITPGTSVETIVSLIGTETANHVTFSPLNVANEATRLALSGLRKFHHVQQADSGDVFLLNDDLNVSDPASWLNLSQPWINTNTTNFAAATQGATIFSTDGSPSIANLINGSRVYGSANWNGQDSDIITVSFNQSRLIHRIDLYSVTADESDRPNQQNSYSILSAEVYLYVGNAWMRMATFYENLGVCISLEFLPVRATQLRLKNLVGGFYAVRLAEIEAY